MQGVALFINQFLLDGTILGYVQTWSVEGARNSLRARRLFEVVESAVLQVDALLMAVSAVVHDSPFCFIGSDREGIMVPKKELVVQWNIIFFLSPSRCSSSIINLIAVFIVNV